MNRSVQSLLCFPEERTFLSPEKNLRKQETGQDNDKTIDLKHHCIIKETKNLFITFTSK